jgi:hypothetical protein
MSAPSLVDIANGALQRLGVGSTGRVEAIDEDSVNGRAISTAFNATRRALLRSYDWAFATARAALPVDAEQTEWGSHNRFGLPDDFLRLILNDETKQYVDWRIEGRFIVTDDSSPLNIMYIADIDDPNIMDSMFIEAWELKMAAKICKAVTGSTEQKKDLLAEFDDMIEEAKRIGSIEKPAQEDMTDDYDNARL